MHVFGKTADFIIRISLQTPVVQQVFAKKKYCRRHALSTIQKSIVEILAIRIFLKYGVRHNKVWAKYDVFVRQYIKVLEQKG